MLGFQPSCHSLFALKHQAPKQKKESTCQKSQSIHTAIPTINRCRDHALPFTTFGGHDNLLPAPLLCIRMNTLFWQLCPLTNESPCREKHVQPPTSGCPLPNSTTTLVECRACTLPVTSSRRLWRSACSTNGASSLPWSPTTRSATKEISALSLQWTSWEFATQVPLCSPHAVLDLPPPSLQPTNQSAERCFPTNQSAERCFPTNQSAKRCFPPHSNNSR